MSQIARRAGLLFVFLIGHTMCWAGQLPPSTSDGGQLAHPPIFNANAPERPVLWKLIPRDIFQDQKTELTFPFALAHGKHWKPTLGIAATTATLVALDSHDTPYFRRTSSFVDFNKILSGRNTILGMAIVPTSFYAVGLVRKDSYAKHTALLVGEAVADAEILDTIMKDATGRLRPSDIFPHGNFSDTWFEGHNSVFGTRASFPSGHTIEAFSIATVFAERYRKHRWVPWVSYGLAGLVGFSRISLQAHFPSDVFAGAALGYLISHEVVLQGQRH
jgi:membrane-associated phospholipid phosphatase